MQKTYGDAGEAYAKLEDFFKHIEHTNPASKWEVKKDADGRFISGALALGCSVNN